MAAGILVYPTLRAALADGYHVYDRYEHGYRVRIRTSAGWAFAFAKAD